LTCPSSDWSSVWATFLRSSALLVAGGERLAGLSVQFHDALPKPLGLELQPLLRGGDVGDPLLDVLQLLDLLLVAVLERLSGILGAIEEL